MPDKAFGGLAEKKSPAGRAFFSLPPLITGIGYTFLYSNKMPETAPSRRAARGAGQQKFPGFPNGGDSE